jgi:hypothetical protein
MTNRRMTMTDSVGQMLLEHLTKMARFHESIDGLLKHEAQRIEACEEGSQQANEMTNGMWERADRAVELNRLVDELERLNEMLADSVQKS